MIALGIVFGTLIGLTLGALGAGGSILAVPVLVHVLGLPVPAATVTSLVAVGSASAVATWGHRSRVDLRLAGWFIALGGVGSALGAALAKRLDDQVVLLAFSVLVLIAAQRMLTACPSCTRVGEASATAATPTAKAGVPTELLAIVLAGLGIGALTGLFGVGGGFVIVPILTLLLGRNLPTAIATSLVVIVGNAVLAVALRGPSEVEWATAAAFTAPMLVGSALGSRIAGRLDPRKSLRAFAATLLLVAVGNALTVVL